MLQHIDLARFLFGKPIPACREARQAVQGGNLNITDVLSEHAHMRPGHPAIEDGNRIVTYAELDALVDAAAANMQTAGIGVGDVICISLPDCVDYLVTLLGLARVGAVMFAIDRKLPASEQRKAAEQAKVRTVIAADNAGRIGSTRLLPVGLICRPAASAFRRPSLDADHPLMIVQSSGTTGAPKTFLWGHARMWIQVPRHRRCFDLTWQDRYLAVVRMSFFWEREICMVIFGLGATIVINHARSVGELVRTASDHQITLLALTPSHLSKLLEHPSLGKPLFPTVRAMVVGSAPLAHERRLHVRDQLTPNFYEQLGTNEAGLMILGTPFDQDKHPAAIGRVVDGVEAQVIGADGRPLPQGEVGLLGFRGEGFPTEYVGNSEATRRAFRKGWFYPGDLAAIDGDGYVFFKGRADDVINNAGAKFYPIEVEKLLLSHPAVAEAAVFGWPHRQNGEVSVACVVTKGDITALELSKFCLHYIAAWKTPHHFLFMKTLPRNAAGKILKLRLKKNFADVFDNQPF